MMENFWFIDKAIDKWGPGRIGSINSQRKNNWQEW